MNILITNVNFIASVELIKCLKRITKTAITIIGTGEEPQEYSYGGGMVDIFLQTPCKNSIELYFAFIKDVLKSYNIDLVISVSDSELKYLTDICSELNTHFICSNKETIGLFQDKLGASIEISKLPLVSIPPILESLIGANKVIFRKRNSVGSKGIYIVDLNEEQYIKNLFTKEYFIQEYIEGTEYTVDVFADKLGQPKIIIPRKRIEIRNGISYRCQIHYNKDVIKSCKTIYNAFKIPGLSNVQFIVQNKTVYFIELNLRFAGTGIAGILASFNYIAEYLDHFINNTELYDYEYYMNKVAWDSIITKCYDERIYYPTNLN